VGTASIPNAPVKPIEEGFLEALDAVGRALDELSPLSMITGGVAVIASGVPRLTVHIDATIKAAGLSVDQLRSSLHRWHIEPRIRDAEAFATAWQVFLGVHRPSGTDIDISLAWLPFEIEALKASHAVDYAGICFRIPRPEDLLIYKLIAMRPQDLEDAEGLLVLHGPTMDLTRVRRIVRQFADALEDDERVAALDRLIRRVQG
jgi:hypothetical protein